MVQLADWATSVVRPKAFQFDADFAAISTNDLRRLPVVRSFKRVESGDGLMAEWIHDCGGNDCYCSQWL
jgi:hypothetical protein